MEPDQEAEYGRIEATLNFAAKELLKRGSMKLLGTMLATTLGWPDYCHAEWALDDDVLKGACVGTQKSPKADLEEKIKKVHTVGYWDKPDNKDIKNWWAWLLRSRSMPTTVYPERAGTRGYLQTPQGCRPPESGCTAR